MWKMPKMTVKEVHTKGSDYDFVVTFPRENIPPVKLTEGWVYVVKPGPWPHVGRKGHFVPMGDNEVALDENPDESDPAFLFFPDPRSLEAVILH